MRKRSDALVFERGPEAHAEPAARHPLELEGLVDRHLLRRRDDVQHGVRVVDQHLVELSGVVLEGPRRHRVVHNLWRAQEREHVPGGWRVRIRLPLSDLGLPPKADGFRFDVIATAMSPIAGQNLLRLPRWGVPNNWANAASLVRVKMPPERI